MVKSPAQGHTPVTCLFFILNFDLFTESGLVPLFLPRGKITNLEDRQWEAANTLASVVPMHT